MTLSLDLLYVGRMLYGYCGARFGRDSYNNKRIEAVGHDWIVVREIDEFGDLGAPDFLHITSDKWAELIKDSERGRADQIRSSLLKSK